MKKTPDFCTRCGGPKHAEGEDCGGVRTLDDIQAEVDAGVTPPEAFTRQEANERARHARTR